MKVRVTAMAVVAMAVVSCSSRGGPATPPGPRAGPFDDRSCSLENVLINTSHLVDVELDGDTETIGFLDLADTGFFGRSVRDRIEMYFYDVTDTTVVSVRHVRSGDPRASEFGALAPGVELVIAHPTNGAAGELISDDAASTSVALGQYERGSPREWIVHAAFDVSDDGTVRFAGDCGSELDRQFDAVTAELVGDGAGDGDVDGGISDVEMLVELVDRALDPGRAGDMRFLERPLETRYFVGREDYVVPALLDGEVRRITWRMRSAGSVEREVGLRSRIGIAGSAVGGGATTVESILAVDSPIEFWQLGPNGELVALLATLPVEQARSAESMVVDVDLTAGTADIELITYEELAALDPELDAEDVRRADAVPITVDRGVPLVAFVG